MRVEKKLKQRPSFKSSEKRLSGIDEPKESPEWLQTKMKKLRDADIQHQQDAEEVIRQKMKDEENAMLKKLEKEETILRNENLRNKQIIDEKENIL